MTHPQLRLVYRGLAASGPKDLRYTTTSLKPANFLNPADIANDPLITGMQGTVAALAQGLNDPDPAARRAAIDVLEAIGPAAAPAGRALVASLADRDPFVRWAAARTVGKLSPIETEKSVPALARLLDDADFDLKLAALTALERCGPEARRAVPELITVVISADTELRISAMHVLASIGGPEGHQAIPTLRAAPRRDATNASRRPPRKRWAGSGQPPNKLSPSFELPFAAATFKFKKPPATHS